MIGTSVAGDRLGYILTNMRSCKKILGMFINRFRYIQTRVTNGFDANKGIRELRVDFEIISSIAAKISRAVPISGSRPDCFVEACQDVCGSFVSAQ
jgi:hypothetical protein